MRTRTCVYRELRTELLYLQLGGDKLQKGSRIRSADCRQSNHHRIRLLRIHLLMQALVGQSSIGKFSTHFVMLTWLTVHRRTLSAPIRSESVPVKKCNIEQDVNVEAVVKKSLQVISSSRRRLKPLTEVVSRPEPTSEKKPSGPVVRSRSALLVQSVVRDHGHLYYQLQVPPRIESPLPTRTEPPQPVTRGTKMSNRSARADAVSMPVQRAAYAANSTESLMVPKEWLKRVSIFSSESPRNSVLTAQRETQSHRNTVTSQTKLRHSVDAHHFTQRQDKRLKKYTQPSTSKLPTK
ncbi:hypothetical protein HBI56_085280 [Parastagonospora nodorum]|nr:hypothetical protein HBH64_097950 [Parastagonospora nodorum]KAH4985751.1 hypothetical protein HBI76_121740 [Parastagonospora nodorum]KAH5007973.1 hypothetical protein HBI77_106540 [Parastagonospora nodorum]KAH5217571.1 hypothetical protein HBI62_166390 [Parastagonospora nodorum]KAH5738626.1 hypothetical protein HBI18_055250 [Parastagonospora nodorum]